MPFEEGITMVWVIIIALLIVLVMIGFLVYLEPKIEGGWLTGLIDAIKFWLQPVV
jgi:hypothetical protein